MEGTQPSPGIVHFGVFEVDLRAGELHKNGLKIKLQEQPFQILVMLLEHPGEVVTREELQQKLWSNDTFVDFGNSLNKAINKIREALGDSAENPRFVETLARRGYRFIAPVDLGRECPADLGGSLSYPKRGLALPKSGIRRWWRRSQTIADVKIALQDVKEELDSEAHITLSAQTRGRRRRLIWSTLALALSVAGGVAVWLNHSMTRVAEAPPTVVPLTSYSGMEGGPSFSPDGSQVAFAWNGEKQDNYDIYVKLIGSGAQLRLTTAPEADFFPAWSPDGRSIAFLRERPGGKGSVFLISPLGPPERKVAEVSDVNRLAWTPDGKSLVVADRNSGNEPMGLFLLSVESSERQRLTSPPDKRFVDGDPAFSPDGGSLAFIRYLFAGLSDIYLLTLSKDFQPIGGPKRLTFENRWTRSPVWSSDGHEIIFGSGQYYGANSLFRIAASGSGKPQRLAAAGEDGSEPAISRRTQRLVYTRGLLDTNIWRVEVPGPQGKISVPMKLISSTRVDGDAQFSPDGKKIVFLSNRTGSEEIWVCDSDGSNALPLTSLGRGAGVSRWSPDGEHIAFISNVDGNWEICVIGANGGKPKRLTNNTAIDMVPSWSRDGKWIYFASNRSGEYQVWKVPAGGGEAVQVTRKGGFVALESPDSQCVYYTKESYADSPLWKLSRDGGEETQVLESVALLNFAIVNEGIYFIPRPDSAAHHSIQFFNFTTKRVRSITTIEKPISHYLSVSPDGRWILYTQVDQAGSDLMLVENFR